MESEQQTLGQTAIDRAARCAEELPVRYNAVEISSTTSRPARTRLRS